MKHTIIARDADPRDGFCLGIVVETTKQMAESEVLDAMRSAARTYCKTSFGQEDIASNNGAFNWGDFVNCVPQCACESRGFRVVDTFVTRLVVDHDESLLPQD